MLAIEIIVLNTMIFANELKGAGQAQGEERQCGMKKRGPGEKASEGSKQPLSIKRKRSDIVAHTAASERDPSARGEQG